MCQIDRNLPYLCRFGTDTVETYPGYVKEGRLIIRCCLK